MDTHFAGLKKCPLFKGISENDLKALLRCLNAKEIKAEKGTAIFAAGDRPDAVGIVLAGSVHILQEDYWGNRTILAAVQAGGLFGEAFTCAEATEFPVTALVNESGSVLLVDCKRILVTCSSACTFHAGLIRNLMRILAIKNISLTQKMEHITKRTTKARVLSYLSECAAKTGANTFVIPFDRQGLADYLSVERSALSATLSKMKREGLIEFEKDRFVLL